MFSGPTSRATGLRPIRRWPMRRARRTTSSSSRKWSNSMDLASLSLSDLQARFRAKEASPVEALEAIESRIKAIDEKLHGYLARDFEKARAAAEAADVSLPLGGVPVAIKDAINVQGESCTCASQILR